MNGVVLTANTVYEVHSFSFALFLEMSLGKHLLSSRNLSNSGCGEEINVTTFHIIKKCLSKDPGIAARACSIRRDTPSTQCQFVVGDPIEN